MNYNNCNKKQRHNHEYTGSVRLAESDDLHNHRFCGVTGEAIPMPNGNHCHELETRTDFYEDHFHMVCMKTGPGIPVGNDRHVHYVKGATTVEDNHCHEYQFATLIENPIGD
jgi:hypothetical protein